MTAKNYLLRAYKLDQEIQSQLDQIASLEDLATSCTSVLSGMPKNPKVGTSSMADAVCRIVDVREEMNRELTRLVELKADAVEVIQRVKNTDQRTVLGMRYLSYYPWETISMKLGLSQSWVLKIHRMALKSVDSILQEKKFSRKPA